MPFSRMGELLLQLVTTLKILNILIIGCLTSISFSCLFFYTISEGILRQQNAAKRIFYQAKHKFAIDQKLWGQFNFISKSRIEMCQFAKKFDRVFGVSVADDTKDMPNLN